MQDQITIEELGTEWDIWILRKFLFGKEKVLKECFCNSILTFMIDSDVEVFIILVNSILMRCIN